jgi:hypothetical protein
LCHADRGGQTDDRTKGQAHMTNLSAAFRNFEKTPKILYRISLRKGPSRRPRRRCVDSIIADVKGTGLESTDWILMDQEKKETGLSCCR